MIDPEFATNKLMSQLEACPEILDPARFPNPMSQRNKIATVTGIVASQFTFVEGILTLGQEAQALSIWHTWLQDKCSTYYEALRNGEHGITDGLDRMSLNRSPELIVLNGLRLGVAQAMRRTYKAAHGTSKQSRSLKLETA